MRILLVLICSLALVCVAGAQPEEPKGQPKKKGAQAGQVSQPPGKAIGQPAEAGKPTGAGKPTTVGKPATTGQPTEVGKPAGAAKGKAATAGKPTTTAKPTPPGKPATAATPKQGATTKTATKPPPGKPTAAASPKAGVGKPGTKPTTAASPAQAGKGAAGATAAAAGKPIKPQHFDVPKQPNTAKAPPVQFQQGRHIEGSQNWQGEQYAVFRNYHSEWHDQGWWQSNYGSNIVFMFGAPYFLNAGYWQPAWGYNPNAYYAYDGPIYAANNLPPDQVIANVQSTLQQQGYYHGDIDGLIGPETRGAIAAYQRDHGLTETAAIDQPTLQSLGMT